MSASILSHNQISSVIEEAKSGRYPLRNETIVLLSFAAGMQVREISALTWRMVVDRDGEVSNTIRLPRRDIQMHRRIRKCLVELMAIRRPKSRDLRVIFSERGEGYSAAGIQVWFDRIYNKLGFDGASSKTGPLTFASNIIGCATARDLNAIRILVSPIVLRRYVKNDLAVEQACEDLINMSL